MKLNGEIEWIVNDVTCLIYKIPLTSWYLWKATDIGIASCYDDAVRMANENAMGTL